MDVISVIVPVYNVEKYLRRCVDSILAQSFTDFELILVDDGSPDRCGEICDEYAKSDPHIHVIHQKNAGQAAAKNAGLDLVYTELKTAWITFIDSDDWVHPAYLETLLSAAKEHKTEVAVCNLIETDGTWTSPSDLSFSASRMSPESLWLKNRLAATIPVCKICSVAAFQGFRFPVGKVHEDEFLLYRILFSYPEIAYVDTQLYYYFQNPDGITLQKKWTPERADSLEAFSEQCVYFHSEGYLLAEELSAQGLFIGCAEVLQNLLTLYPEEKKLISKNRFLMRRVWRRYKSTLTLSMVGGKRNYDRLTHPYKTIIKKKGKNAVIFIRRVLHV